MSNTNEKTTESPTQPKTPPVTEMLVASLIKTFEPAIAPGPDVEMMTTIDIIDEMAAIADVEKWEVVTALKQSGFTIHHNEAGFFWLLKRK